MAVPKSKITKSKRNMRRAHDALSSDAYVEDKTTGELHRPHHIDLKTGMYRGKQIILKKVKKEESAETSPSVASDEANKTIEAPK